MLPRFIFLKMGFSERQVSNCYFEVNTFIFYNVLPPPSLKAHCLKDSSSLF